MESVGPSCASGGASASSSLGRSARVSVPPEMTFESEMAQRQSALAGDPAALAIDQLAVLPVGEYTRPAKQQKLMGGDASFKDQQRLQHANQFGPARTQECSDYEVPGHVEQTKPFQTEYGSEKSEESTGRQGPGDTIGETVSPAKDDGQSSPQSMPVSRAERQLR